MRPYSKRGPGDPRDLTKRVVIVAEKAMLDRRMTNPTMRVLMFMGIAPVNWKAASQTTIAQSTYLRRCTVNRALRTLEEWGYIEVRGDPAGSSLKQYRAIIPSQPIDDSVEYVVQTVRDHVEDMRSQFARQREFLLDSGFLDDECRACREPAEVIDHIVPLVRGGTNDVENLQPLCHACNRAKKAKTMDEFMAARRGEAGHA